MAINILRDRNIKQYCQCYGILSGAIPMPEAMKTKREKDAKKREKEDIIREYENKIAELESMRMSALSSFGFEEKD